MNNYHLSNEEKDFIKANLSADVGKLAFSKDKYKFDDISFILSQISGKQKIKSKCPVFHDNPELILPPSLSLEQASSDLTAEYKANICNYSSVWDLTGGMGIDSIAFSTKATIMIYAERSPELYSIFSHNAKVLDLKNIKAINTDAVEYLSEAKELPDLIFIDPARRGKQGQKTYFLEDTEPSPLAIIKLLKNSHTKLLVKTSPLLDISRAIKQMQFVTQVHAVCLANECKELLFLLDFKAKDTIKYYATTLSSSENETIEFNGDLDKSINFSMPLNYLYEPNPAIMKLGLFAELCEKYNINKLAPNSHLFSSDELISDFPGRKFIIKSIEKYSKKQLSKLLPNKSANITVRNFPLSVEDIRRQTGIKSGGDTYIFCTRNSANESLAIICEKANQSL